MNYKQRGGRWGFVGGGGVGLGKWQGERSSEHGDEDDYIIISAKIN